MEIGGCGFATYGSFRAYAANRYTVEHSAYIDRAYRGHGRGLGKTLRAELIEAAIQRWIWPSINNN